MIYFYIYVMCYILFSKVQVVKFKSRLMKLDINGIG